MAIYLRSERVIRIQKALKGKTEMEDLYLIELTGQRRFSVTLKGLTADGGVEEIIRTATKTRGNEIKESQLPLFRRTA